MSRIARVRMPDGRVARFSVPDDATPEQITAQAQKLTQQQSKPKKQGALGWLSDNVLSPLNEAIIGAPEGIYNAASAVTDPISGLIFGEDAVKQARQQRRKVSDAATNALVTRRAPIARDIGRIAGTMAIPLPGKKLQEGGRLARAAYRAMQGAVGGAGVREVDQSAAAPAAIGATANVVLPPVISKLAQTRPAQAMGRMASRVAAPVVNKLDDLAEAAQPGINQFLGRPNVPLQGLPAVPPQAPLSALGRQAQARAARFKALGIDDPTTGMVTRDPAAFSFEQNIAKTAAGDDLARQMKEVEVGLVEKGRSIVRDMGGAKGPEATGKAVEDVLDTKRGEMQRVTSSLYKQVRDTRGDEAVGRLDILRARMTEPEVTYNPKFDEMREGISRWMTANGLISKDGRLTKPVTVSQAEELRKLIGSLGSNMEPGVRMMRSKLIDALDDDVVGTIGDDAFKAARASARARFEEFSKTFPGKLADEKLAPELLTKRVLGDGVKLSDLRALRKSLTTGTDEQVARGMEAWKGLQTQAVDDLLNKSVDADGNLIGATLSREFNKSALKFREILPPEDFKMLRRLSAATRDVKSFPVGHSVNTSNTAVTLANMFEQAPAKVKTGWLKLMAKYGLQHGAAAAVSFPYGNVALEVGRKAAGSVAEQRAASALAEKIRLAQSPEATAAAIREAQSAAASNPAVAEFLRQAGVAIGGTAAAQ